VLPETGEIGVSISLGRFFADRAGRLRVTVTVARSGLDGVVLHYVIERSNGGWFVVDVVLVAKLAA
jgi:ABC-type transporter MlaC component